MNLSNLKDWALARAREPSTWQGVVLVLTSLGTALTPDQQKAIVAIGLALAGAIGAMTSDKKNTPGDDHE